MKERVKILAAAVLLGGVCLALGGCPHGSSSADDAGNSATKIEVTLTRVTRGTIARTVALTGTVAGLPNRDIRVSALVPGRVVDMKVAEGDVVHAGDVLARLDDTPLRNQLQQAEAAVAQARASYKNAKAAHARNEDLFKRGIAARKDLEDAETQENVAEAALHQSEALLEQARLQVARTEIVSPIDGRVAKRFVNVGEQVDGTAAQPVLEVASLDEVELLGNFPAAYLESVRVGEMISVTTDALPGKTFRGRVVAISPVVDPMTNVGLARIRLPNPGGLLRIGMFLSAEIAMEAHANALTVPRESIYRDEKGEPRVFRVEKDVATAVSVRLGIETSDRVEILGGVSEGDAVILTGGYGLGDKAKVVVRP